MSEPLPLHRCPTCGTCSHKAPPPSPVTLSVPVGRLTDPSTVRRIAHAADVGARSSFTAGDHVPAWFLVDLAVALRWHAAELERLHDQVVDDAMRELEENR